MTQFQNKRFSVSMGEGDYGDNWERTFGKEGWREKARAEEKAIYDAQVQAETPLEHISDAPRSPRALCLACGAPCFVHHCYNCDADDPLAAEPQKEAARLARDNTRLRTLVKMLALDPSRGRKEPDMCRACGVVLRDAEAYTDEPKTHPHADDCPVFTPDGRIK